MCWLEKKAGPWKHSVWNIHLIDKKITLKTEDMNDDMSVVTLCIVVLQCEKVTMV